MKHGRDSRTYSKDARDMAMKAGIYEVVPLTSLVAQVSSLSNQLVTLASQGVHPQVETVAATSMSQSIVGMNRE